MDQINPHITHDPAETDRRPPMKDRHITDQEREVRRVLDQMVDYVNNAPGYTGNPRKWLRDLREVFPAPEPTLAEKLRQHADAADNIPNLGSAHDVDRLAADLASDLRAAACRVIDRPEALDALPEEAVVLSVNTRYALQHGDDGESWYGPASIRNATSAQVLAHGPVIVLWEPEVTA